MMEFRQRPHVVNSLGSVIELWEDGLMVGAIYPEHRGIKLLSKYVSPVVEFEPPEPVATIKIKFDKPTS